MKPGHVTSQKKQILGFIMNVLDYIIDGYGYYIITINLSPILRLQLDSLKDD